ncbi:MAG: hypothetical protein ACRDA4_06745 [Filifactoraceae bacterium]
MREVNYYFKKHMISTVIAGILFIIQGLGIVALVFYGNDVINYGLIRYGYEAAAPEALLKTSFDSRVESLSKEDKDFVISNYTLLDKSKITEEQYNKYKEIYPSIESKVIYKKNWIGIREVKEKLDKIFFISAEDMLYEYANLGINPELMQKKYINNKLKCMMLASVVFALAFIGGNFIIAGIAAKAGYEERKKLVETHGDNLKSSFDLQDKLKKFSGWFYAGVLGLGAFGTAVYCYVKSGVSYSDEGQVILWLIALLVFSVAIYSAISIRGVLNKGIFIVVKVSLLAVVTVLYGNKASIIIICAYIFMVLILELIRWLIKTKLNILVKAHEDNIDNIDGQLTFVVKKETIDIEPIQMKKLVKEYFNNNEYLYRSSWLLEVLESMDKVVVALFNFWGVIISIMVFSYMYINLGVPMLGIVPLLVIFSF